MPPYPPGRLETVKIPEEISALIGTVGPHQSTTVPRPAEARGVFQVPVILIDFDDHPAWPERHPSSYYESLLFASGAGIRSLRTYYDENSYGTLDVQGSVTPWLRSRYLYNTHYVNRDGVSGTYNGINDDYGFDFSIAAGEGTDHPRNVWGLVKEAVELADPYLDFREFDNDGDGVIEAVIVVHSGCGAEADDCVPAADHVWSHQSSLRAYLETQAPHLWPVVVDGKVANVYTLNPEDGPLGVFCHELGHTLGLPDLYKFDVFPAQTRVGRFCLMDYGGWSGWPPGAVPSHLCSWCKSVLGWLVPEAVDSQTDPLLQPVRVGLRPVERTALAYRILDNPSGVDWTASRAGTGEYFLIENRQPVGYDQWLFLEGGDDDGGLLLLHVDESRPDNNSPDTLLVSVLQADGGGLHEIGTGQAADLWGQGREFTPWSTPSSQRYGGGFSGVSVTRIEAPTSEDFEATLSRAEVEPGADLTVYPNPWVVEGQEPRAVIRLSVPKDAAEADASRRLTVWIYDLAGSVVRVLDDDAEAPTGGGRAYWDGRNEDGHPAAAGVYFLLVDDGSRRATGKMAVVR